MMKREREGSLEPVWPPRRVLVAPDKFKGTLSAEQAARAMVRGLRRAWPDTEYEVCALADGGEGFARLLTRSGGGSWRRVKTVDAAGRPCWAGWGLLGDGRTAVLDLATASGLARLPEELRNPMDTSTFGTGLVVRRALQAGAETIILGLGGSATNDGGVGVAAALGWRFLDRHGRSIPLTGRGLAALERIEPGRLAARVRFIAACDVDNPLFGLKGAAHQFAPQKGANADEVRTLDAGLRRLASIARRDLRSGYERANGAGAAGGCGYGLLTFFGARIVPGFDVISERLDLEKRMRSCDLVVTGEGRLDRTTLAGKAPQRVALAARRLGKPVWGVFGSSAFSRPPEPFGRMEAVVGDSGEDLAALSLGEHAGRLERAAYRLAGATAFSGPAARVSEGSA